MSEAQPRAREIHWRGERVGYVRDVRFETAIATAQKLRGRWDPVDSATAREFTRRLFSGESFAVTLPAGRFALSADEEGQVFLLIHRSKPKGGNSDWVYDE
jgi:hypothetical protein